MNVTDNTALKFLDLVPESIYQRLVTHQYRNKKSSSGDDSLLQRTQGVLQIRRQLLQGKRISYKALSKWLHSSLLENIYIKLNDHSLLSKTLNNDVFTDDVILHVLNWLDQVDDEISLLNSVSFNVSAADNESQRLTAADAPLKTKQHNYANINNNTYRAMQDLANGFGIERTLGWDLIKGIESATDIKKLLSAHSIIKKSPQLQAIIQLIGRQRSVKAAERESDAIHFRLSDSPRSVNGLPDEHSVNSVTGVCYGDDISKMLPSELVMLGNKNLKYLWHARRAEHQLLNYHYRGLMSEHVPQVAPLSLMPEKQAKKNLQTNGPVILCVDTSASMKGRAEQLAKAIALETMRVTRKQNRACYVLVFGASGEIKQRLLNIDQGWKSIIKFLRYAFNGGTDINQLMLHVLELHYEKKWQDADVLLLSDGRFKADSKTINRLKFSALNIRVYGIQLARWNTAAFDELCHQVFDLSHA